jgi:hypothetical protein
MDVKIDGRTVPQAGECRNLLRMLDFAFDSGLHELSVQLIASLYRLLDDNLDAVGSLG